MHRLKSNFAQIAADQKKKLGIKNLAFRLNIAEGTLRKLLDDRWEYFHRDNIERFCDYFDVDIGQVFELVSDTFWEPFQSVNTCHFVRGTTEASKKHVRTRDLDAMVKIQNFLQESFPEFNSTESDFGSVELDLMEVVKSQNCIVLGSHRSNVASEILLSRFFEAQPSDPSEENRRKMPFAFVYPPDWSSASTLTKEPTGDGFGIFIRRGRGALVHADYLPIDAFKISEASHARDCGVVFVANHPFRTNSNVKLIWLGGFSGIGTVGAADALVSDFRDLEPLNGESHVFGVVEAIYSKSGKRGDTRKYKNYSWAFREGGRAPIPLGSEE